MWDDKIWQEGIGDKPVGIAKSTRVTTAVKQSISNTSAILHRVVVNQPTSVAFYAHLYDYSQTISAGFGSGVGIVHKFYLPTDTDVKVPGAISSGARFSKGIWLDVSATCDVTVVYEN